MYLVVFPLSCLKNLDFMKFNSYLTVICEVVIVCVIVAFFFAYDKPHDAPVAFNVNFNMMSTLPLMAASMCGHFATPYVYKELKNRTMKKMNAVIIFNGVILLSLYALIAFFGYFTFTDTVN